MQTKSNIGDVAASLRQTSISPPSLASPGCMEPICQSLAASCETVQESRQLVKPPCLIIPPLFACLSERRPTEEPNVQTPADSDGVQSSSQVPAKEKTTSRVSFHCEGGKLIIFPSECQCWFNHQIQNHSNNISYSFSTKASFIKLSSKTSLVEDVLTEM